MKERGFPFWPVVVSGASAGGLGIAALARPAVGVRLLTDTVGVDALAGILTAAWVLAGLCGFAIALRVRGPARSGIAVLAVAALAVGGAFRIWPGLSAGALVILTGLGGLAVGLWLIGVAVQLRQLSHED